uniref:Uncharacterized protein n=1 Tax=Mycena chlorophos TaxID=658473 RepID=A0ABQ0KVE6_MYCCL|nr:predicted protein [Mycena chlorophos]
MQHAYPTAHHGYSSGGSIVRGFSPKNGQPETQLLSQRQHTISKANARVFYPSTHRRARPPTQVDERPPDYWHDPSRLLSINFGSKNDFPYSVSFIPQWGPCKSGVALLNLEHGRGAKHGDAPISDELPSRYATAKLQIKWPGYNEEIYPLELVDPKTQRPLTRAQLGAQVTHLFKQFANTRAHAEFDDSEFGIFLGLDGVQYDQVRLCEVFTHDGYHFFAQFALVPHYCHLGV